MSKRVTSKTFGQLVPRYLGPLGNRCAAVAGVPGSPLIYYAGAASGGVFKTVDGGIHWKAVFDGQHEALRNQPLPEKGQSIGALAVAESNPGIVWAGTGESWIRGPISIGNGVYKSTNAGKTWTRMGLKNSGRIAKIVIHPTDPNTVWVAAMGSCYPDKKGKLNFRKQQRGVYKTTDGGHTWEHTLQPNGRTGCSDLALDYCNPDVIYAGMWQFWMSTYIRVSGGQGGGVFKSEDGGNTWKELTNGLPKGLTDPKGHPYPVGKISVGLCRSKPSVVYAQIETGDGESTWNFQNVTTGQLWKSTDAGASWKLVSKNRNINSRAAYYTRHAVCPNDENKVFFFAPHLGITRDGGKTLDVYGFPRAPGVDHHEGWIDPQNSNRIAVAHDIGISISQDGGKSWQKIQLPIAQIYSVAVDNDVPYNVYGNVQDWVSFWGPNNARIPYNGSQGDMRPGALARGVWTQGGSGECGWSIPELNSDWLWSSGASDSPNGGTIALINRKTGHSGLVTVDPVFTIGTDPREEVYRFHWHMPLFLSPHDSPGGSEKPRRVFAGSQYVHATTDRGQSWHIISGDLTVPDQNYLKSSGGITADNLNVRTVFCTTAIAESPVKRGILWVGTNDQRVWVGTEGRWGSKWDFVELTDNIKGMPAAVPGSWAVVSCIAPSQFDRDTAYVCFDKQQNSDTNPYIFKTRNKGRTWKKISDGIPRGIFSNVHWLYEDPKRRGLLYCGTENALYISFDDGDNWQVLPGLPPAPVSGIVVQEKFQDLVLSTFGRGFYVYDDITPLRKLDKVLEDDVHLFDFKRPCFRFQDIVQPLGIPHDNDPTLGSDPESPVPITYYLKEKSDSVTLRFYDEGKECVREVSGLPGKKGLNRYWWDLMSNTSTTILLRTNPPQLDYLPYCETSGINHIRPFSNPIAGITLSWMLEPGIYTVELEVDVPGATRPVKKYRKMDLQIDPTTTASKKDIRRQIKLFRKVYDLLDTVAKDINLIEWINYQIEELEKTITDPKVLTLLKDNRVGLQVIEFGLYQSSITGQGEDLARFPAKLLSNLAYLAGTIGTGDFAPTESSKKRHKELQKDVKAYRKPLDTALNSVEGPLNTALKRIGTKPISCKLPDSKPCPKLFAPKSAF